MIPATLVLVTGISGVTLKIANIELKGMALATIVGVLMALLFKVFEITGLSNEK